ncbi:DUF551 domain-containing protein [Klebsiella pneumoniae]
MPGEGETVLGCCGLNGRHSGIYTMRASVIHRKNSAIDTYGIKHERVTHWMPLPAAPAGGEAMTEGMRQHRAFVLTCLPARAKRITAQEVKGE